MVSVTHGESRFCTFSSCLSQQTAPGAFLQSGKKKRITTPPANAGVIAGPSCIAPAASYQPRTYQRLKTAP